MATTTPAPQTLAGPALDNRRIAAAAIDLAAPALAGIALLATGLLTPATALVLLGWTLYYFFALESGGGQTLGKRAMHLKVVSADGGEPTMRQYGMRSLVRAVDLPGVGLVAMIGSGDRRQRLGDMAAHTSVVDAQAADVAQMDAFDAAHLHARQAPAEPKPKRSRRGLGGPELKMPSFGRSKAAEVPAAAVAQAPEAATEVQPPQQPTPAQQPEPAKAGRKTLGGPELKLPSFGRSKGPKAPKAPKQPKPAKAAKSGRPTLGGPEIKLPSFGRRKKQQPLAPPPPPATAEPEPMAAQSDPPVPPIPAVEPPAPEQTAPEPPPAPEVKPFDPFAADAPEPSVEVVSHGDPDPSPDPVAASEPPQPSIMDRDAPEVEIVRDEPDEEPPAPSPVTPAIPASPPPAVEQPPAAPAEPAPVAQEPPEPEHVEGIRDDGSSRVHVKPIETVSAMELLMREAEEQDRQST